MYSGQHNNEKELFQLVAAGDEIAFRQLFEAYKKRLLALVFRLCKTETATEDILQEVFISIWQHRERLAELEEPSLYILTTARNKTFKYLRKLSLDKRMQQQVWYRISATADNQTQEQVELRESQALIEKGLSLLSRQKQTVYWLSRQQGLNHEQIAAQLNLSKSRVKNIIVEVLQYIRQYLQNHGTLFPIFLLATSPELISHLPL
ncbi:sigma-70 family RNA polymerase sigma factor [Chitinophaga sp. SYP-B3965]|uniref:RNA polymerase sigma factor n=1 Tax=Chitinophaga sp. SYP-B3965 TaxID=2663120 RepID=UPI001299D1D1|nr:sigma-70 family RNA polymerase sigma factor [Chitinophaga sp. SYP-B3965]MRG47530.1 sigma-70 family RNA polymerase sigma factor [Chitinophaga sp. SYP-B3965]